MLIWMCISVYLGICLYEFNFLLNFRKAESIRVFVVVDVVSKMIDHNTHFPIQRGYTKQERQKDV